VGLQSGLPQLAVTARHSVLQLEEPSVLWEGLSPRRHHPLITAITITIITRAIGGENITVLIADKPEGVPRQPPRQMRPRGIDGMPPFEAFIVNCAPAECAEAESLSLVVTSLQASEIVSRAALN
jgi:hypothetical protein